MAKKSQPDSKGNSSGLLCRVENAARFTPSCRMKGILPKKWQELFPACPLTGLHLPKGGLITATLKIGTDPTGGSRHILKCQTRGSREACGGGYTSWCYRRIYKVMSQKAREIRESRELIAAIRLKPIVLQD